MDIAPTFRCCKIVHTNDLFFLLKESNKICLRVIIEAFHQKSETKKDYSQLELYNVF